MLQSAIRPPPLTISSFLSLLIPSISLSRSAHLAPLSSLHPEEVGHALLKLPCSLTPPPHPRPRTYTIHSIEHYIERLPLRRSPRGLTRTHIVYCGEK